MDLEDFVGAWEILAAVELVGNGQHFVVVATAAKTAAGVMDAVAAFAALVAAAAAVVETAASRELAATEPVGNVAATPDVVAVAVAAAGQQAALQQISSHSMAVVGANDQMQGSLITAHS